MIVYWHYDTAGQLLYVGVTANLEDRCLQHRGNSGWWPDVARIVWTRFETPAKARAVERGAIRAGRPLYNVRDNPDGNNARYLRALLPYRQAS